MVYHAQFPPVKSLYQISTFATDPCPCRSPILALDRRSPILALDHNKCFSISSPCNIYHPNSSSLAACCHIYLPTALSSFPLLQLSACEGPLFAPIGLARCFASTSTKMALPSFVSELHADSAFQVTSEAPELPANPGAITGTGGTTDLAPETAPQGPFEEGSSPEGVAPAVGTSLSTSETADPSGTPAAATPAAPAIEERGSETQVVRPEDLYGTGVTTWEASNQVGPSPDGLDAPPQVQPTPGDPSLA